MTTRILTEGFPGDTRAATKAGSNIRHHKERIEDKANYLCDLCALCGKKYLVGFGAWSERSERRKQNAILFVSHKENGPDRDVPSFYY